MAKKFKYSHLYTIGNTAPTTSNINVAEIALGLGDTKKIWTKDANGNVVDLGAEIASLSDVEIISGASSEANVAVEYKLVKSGTTAALGQTIKIYKDSALVNFYLGHVDDFLTDEDEETGESPTSAVTNGSGDTALVYIMQLSDGNYKLAAVNVESFLEESEFKSGVTVDSGTHIVHGVVDSESEKDSQEPQVPFLTVGANGFKINGIKAEIDRKIGALDATAGTQTIASGKHVAVEVAEADGKLTAVTVTEANIADASALANEIAARKAVDGQNGDTYTANTSANYISGATSLNDADVKLDAAVKTVEDEIDDRLGTGVTSANTATDQLEALSGTTGDTSASTSVIGAKIYAADYTDSAISGLDATVGSTSVDTGKHVAVQVVETDGKLTAVTVTEADIASASALNALSAKTVTEIGSTNGSISATTAATAGGTVEYDIQTDASKIKLTGYTSGATDLFAITSANTVTEAFQEIEDKLYKDYTNNTGTNIVFSDSDPNGTVTLSAGTF